MRKENINKIKFTIFIVFIVCILVFVLLNWNTIKHLKIHKLLKYLEGIGPVAMVVYLAMHIMKPFFIVIPSNILALGAGIVFGPIKGFLLTMFGFFLSGTVAFYISRFLGKDFVESIIGGKLMKLDNNMEKNGFKILFLLRLPPVLPYDPLSYACGLTKIKYWDFIIASLIGVVPETICYSIIGREAHNPLSPKFLIPISVLIVAVVGSKFIMDKRHKIS